MVVYSIGYAKKKAEEFFGILKTIGIKQLIDIRANNTSQLAGFTKRDDLRFFLKEICKADYIHDLRLAPTAAMLWAYRKKKIDWAEYEKEFENVLLERRIEETLAKDTFEKTSVLLCSEEKAEHCHRRLVLEYLNSKWANLEIIHL